MPRFNRTWRLVAGRPGQRGVEIGYPLRITFEVEKDAAEEPNGAKLRLYNLRPETRRVLESPDTFIVVYAGYVEEGAALMLAAGNVVDAYTRWERPDVITQIELSDGYVNLRDSAVSVGYGPGVSSGAIISDLASQMSLKLDIPGDAAARTWANGFSFYGAAHKALHKVVQGTGLEWSIQNGALQVIDKRGVSARRAIVLAADSGLIGTPERTREGAKEKAKVKDEKSGDNKQIASSEQQKDGWRVKSLLLPQVNPGDTIKLESRTVNDFFRVDKVSHAGDSDGAGDWQTELQLADLSAPVKQKKATK